MMQESSSSRNEADNFELQNDSLQFDDQQQTRERIKTVNDKIGGGGGGTSTNSYPNYPNVINNQAV